jgi:uncharacterized membrane-anchored protein YitT (DUF2179 family)
MKKENRILKEINNWFFICIGLAVFAFGWTAFLIPHNMTGGGVSGIAAVIYFATGFIPVGMSTLILNLILAGIAWRVLGKKFVINSVICTLILSFFLNVGQLVFTQPLVDDVFMCALIGAGLAGFGVGLALNYGGNTGGTDIIVLMINKYRNASYGRVTLYLNIGIVLSSYLSVGSIEKLVYSIVVMFAYTFISDIIIDGFKQTFQFLVFSSKNKEIAEKINSEIHRGATFIKGYGSYSKEESDILLIIAHRTDKVNIIRIIKQIDDTSFISISKANSVFGKNFEQLKV